MVVVIDGNNLACRCFFAIEPLTTSGGKQTNATYGFLNSLQAYGERFKNSNFFIVWDGAGKKEAHELYSEYKSNRSKLPQELFDQIKDIQRVVSILGIPQYQIDNVEADDVVGTIAIKARKLGKKVIIISNDHDFEQLITNHIKIITPALSIVKETMKSKSFVLKKYGGLKPKQLTDFMAIVGDGSDNVKGVPGVGDKTVIPLMNANGSLENIFKNINNLKTFDKNGVLKDVSDKLKSKIYDNIDLIKVFKRIVTLDCNVDIEIDFNSKKNINKESLENIFYELEFNKFLGKIDKWISIFAK